MNVLSLFDGISCGQVALRRAGISYSRYFSCEISKPAMWVTAKNFPETKFLGDVTKVWGLDLPKIDLLIGGSPCQSFSSAGKQEGFSGSSGLFYEYLRLLCETSPTHFLLENVKMKRCYRDTISRQLGVEPVEINSSLVSAQNRKRLYWTNIPNVVQPEDRGIQLKDILENLPFTNAPYIEPYKSSVPVNYKTSKFNTLRASAGSRTKGIGVCDDLGWWRKLTPVECEKLQTLPKNYTEGIPKTQRYSAIGNGWTVDVIAHIFKNLV